MVAPQKRHSLSRLDALDRDDGENLYVIRGLYKLALGWQDRGHLNAAKTIYQFIVKVPERTPSVNCEEVTKSMGNLASIFLIQDAFMEAEDTFLKAIARCYETLGDEHELFALLLREYACLLRRMGLSDQAQALEQRADQVAPANLPVLI